MATVEEILAGMPTDHAIGAWTGIEYIIDNELRVVSIPKDGVVLGVEGDKDTNIVRFKMPRMYRGIDLGEGFDIRINYANAKGELGYFAVVDKEVALDSITFDWTVGSHAMKYVGSVNFTVSLMKILPDGQIDKRFNTTIAKAKCLSGLNVDIDIPEQQVIDLLTQLKNDVRADIQPSLDGAKADAASAKQSATQASESAKQSKSSADISKQKADSASNSAITATQKAAEAAGSAESVRIGLETVEAKVATATQAATTATSKAGEASASAANAKASQDSAAASATSADKSKTQAAASAVHVDEVKSAVDISAKAAESAKTAALDAQKKSEAAKDQATNASNLAQDALKKSPYIGQNDHWFTYQNGVATDTGIVARGQRGSDGVGVIPGGTKSQVLAKKSNTDHDTEWVDQVSVPDKIVTYEDTTYGRYTKPVTVKANGTEPIDALIVRNDDPAYTSDASITKDGVMFSMSQDGMHVETGIGTTNVFSNNLSGTDHSVEIGRNLRKNFDGIGFSGDSVIKSIDGSALDIEATNLIVKNKFSSQQAIETQMLSLKGDFVGINAPAESTFVVNGNPMFSGDISLLKPVTFGGALQKISIGSDSAGDILQVTSPNGVTVNDKKVLVEGDIPEPKPNENVLKGEAQGVIANANDIWPGPILKSKVLGQSNQVVTTGKNLLGGEPYVLGYNIRGFKNTLKPNTQYTYSISGIDDSKSAFRLMAYNNSTKNEIGLNRGYIRNTSETFTTPENISDFDELYLGGNYTDSGTNSINAFFQVEEGAKATDWEPYTGGKPSPSPEYPQEITNLNKAELVITGRNICPDTELLGGVSYSSGIPTNKFGIQAKFPYVQPSETYGIGAVLNTIKGVTYSIAYLGKANTAAVGIAEYKSADDVGDTGKAVSYASVASSKKSSLTASIDGVMVFILASQWSNGTTNINTFAKEDMIISVGEPCSTYTPHQSKSTPIDLKGNELCSLVENRKWYPNIYKDELVIDAEGNVSLIKRVFSAHIDKLETDTLGATDIFQYFSYTPKTVRPIDGSLAIRSNRFGEIGREPWKFYIAGGNYTAIFFTFPLGTFENKVALNEWLSKNPIDVNYLGVEPQTIPLGKVELPALPDSTSNVWNNGNIPANVYIQYLKDVNIAYADLEAQIKQLTASVAANTLEIATK